MKKKKIKIKWDNVALLVVLLFCIFVVVHDLFIITIYPWIYGDVVGWTWFGLITFILAFAFGTEIIEYFIEEMNEKKIYELDRTHKSKM